MPSSNRDSSRIWVRLSEDQLKQLDEARAENGQDRSDWIRHVIMRKISGQAQHERDLEQALAKRMSQESNRLLLDLVYRIDQLETRIFHENSAILHLGFMILLRATCASLAAQQSMVATGFIEEDQVEPMREAAEMTGVAQYERTHADLKPFLKELRDKAKKKAGELPRASLTETSGEVAPS